MRHYRCIFLLKHKKEGNDNYNTTKEKGDGSKLLSPSSLEHHHKKKL
jgi:hypothetical protein